MKSGRFHGKDLYLACICVTRSFYGDLMVILGSPGNHYHTGYTFDFNVK